MTFPALSLKIAAPARSEVLRLAPRRLVVAGWTGRDPEALRAHIEELGRLGVAAPSRTPTYMHLAPGLLTTDDAIEVVGPQSSGEVECVLFRDGEGLWVGVGSDHTDRAMEVHDIPAAKQMCAKPVAPEVWPWETVADHVDRLILRSWMTVDGRRRLYQEGTLGANRSVTGILDGIPAGGGPGRDPLCLFCGTFPAQGGVAYGERFEFEMEDPVRGVRIRHAYRLRHLPQYL